MRRKRMLNHERRASNVEVFKAHTRIEEKHMGHARAAIALVVCWMGSLATLTSAAEPPAVSVRTARSTGVARLVTPATGQTHIAIEPRGGRRIAGTSDFLAAHGRLFGITRAATELKLEDTRIDHLGRTRTRYTQQYNGLPVYGTFLDVHQDKAGRFTAAGGTFVPGIAVDTQPTVTASAARRVALLLSAKEHLAKDLMVESSELTIFRANLLRGMPGANHLAWDIVVANGTSVHDRVFVDARGGFVIDRITEICDVLDREIYDAGHGAEFLVWEEGDATPFGVDDIDNAIDYSEDTYNVFASMTDGDYLSWNGDDITMQVVTNTPFLNCPNASWNGTWTNYCPGVTPDDVVGHEWAHAYTDGTHDLIYQWQSGALNESYSDIFGEVVDLLNGAGLDSPTSLRLSDECSSIGGGFPPVFEVTSPGALAGVYTVAGAAFNPPAPATVSGTLEYVNDGDDEGGEASVNDGCQPFVGFTAGNIALIDRGSCPFVAKVNNAEAAGASGAVIVNNAGDNVFSMSGGGAPTIAAVMLGQSDGDLIKNELPGVEATFDFPPSIDPSLRWLTGEDSTGFGGAIRDMWNPNCFGDPGSTQDVGFYHCGTSDGGGVHTNSGVPNHTFALLVDGGTYNGFTINSVGLTKAAHIYWRAMSVYQGPTSNFADHADALEMSCADLVGVNLMALSTDSPAGVPSGEMITNTDCIQVTAAIAATALRTAPDHCGFVPLLEPNAPALCPGEKVSVFFNEDWETGLGSWTVGTRDLLDPGTFDTPDWAVVDGLPAGREGSAAFVADLIIGNCTDDTEAGVLFMDSPSIAIPLTAISPRLTFDHWVATETNWDGGNLKISINDGPWQIVPASAFTFNPYNTILNIGDNPLSGEEAFSGLDGGELTGSWGQSQVNLNGIALPGDDIRLRFEMGLDGCNGVVGWYVDEVVAYECTACKCELHADVAPPLCNVNVDDVIYVLDAYVSANPMRSFPGSDVVPCDGGAPFNVDLDDILATIDSSAGNPHCAHPCAP